MNEHARRPVATLDTPSTDAALGVVLHQAVEAAARAPSIFNTQPWRWRLQDQQLELRADRARQLTGTDPHGRMLIVSCGVALDHALVALAASGCWARVERFPDENDPGLLARIVPTGAYEPTAADGQLLRAITERRTDRRPFADTPVPTGTIDRLRRMVESRSVYLAEVDADSLVEFQVIAARAGELDQSDPAYQAELARWTHRLDETKDGVVGTGTVSQTRRRIPLRAFFPDGGDRLLPGPGQDRGARYLVLWSTADDAEAWLAAGEAMSAILLDTTVAGLGASPMSDVIEAPISRTLMHGLLGHLGHAHIVLRIGMPATAHPIPATPRRAVDDLTTVDPGRA